jgi:hypothetical protein
LRLALLYREKLLFTGDHLWLDEDDLRLDMGRGVCWYSWRCPSRSSPAGAVGGGDAPRSTRRWRG